MFLLPGNVPANFFDFEEECGSLSRIYDLRMVKKSCGQTTRYSISHRLRHSSIGCLADIHMTRLPQVSSGLGACPPEVLKKCLLYLQQDCA